MSEWYRKKPIAVRAFQMTLERMNNFRLDWPEHLKTAFKQGKGVEGGLYVHEKDEGGTITMLAIETLEGPHLIRPNVWIVQGPKGEIWGVQPDIFNETYEPVEA